MLVRFVSSAFILALVDHLELVSLVQKTDSPACVSYSSKTNPTEHTVCVCVRVCVCGVCVCVVCVCVCVICMAASNKPVKLRKYLVCSKCLVTFSIVQLILRVKSSHFSKNPCSWEYLHADWLSKFTFLTNGSFLVCK